MNNKLVADYPMASNGKMIANTKAAGIGAVVGLMFWFTQFFILGSDKGIFASWSVIPVMRIFDWASKRGIIAADDISTGLLAIGTYWMIIGALAALLARKLLKKWKNPEAQQTHPAKRR